MDETLFYGRADGVVFPLVQRTQQNLRVQLHSQQSLSPEDESSQSSTTRIVFVHTSAECKPDTNIRCSYFIQASDIWLSSYNPIHLIPLFLCYWGWLCKFLSQLCFHTDVTMLLRVLHRYIALILILYQVEENYSVVLCGYDLVHNSHRDFDLWPLNQWMHVQCKDSTPLL